MKVEAIVVAAGVGSRMQSPIKKPYLLLHQIPLMIHTLRALSKCVGIHRMVVVTGEEDQMYAKELIRRFQVEGTFAWVSGGKERQDSVRCGLAGISQDTDVVLVHDVARPFITADEVQRVIMAAWESGASTLATPVKDTIKEVKNGLAIRTIPRQTIYAVQTPQAFQAPLLRYAHEKAKIEGVQVTDDASLVEWLGQPVAIVQGSYRNIKITTPEDLLIAEAFLSERGEHV